MEKCDITVLMPVYNGAKYLAEAIESVLFQTLHNYEFLIINDGSVDETASIAMTYARKDNRIRVINEPHRGLIGTLNRGLELANGEYIARMDADDIAGSKWLETIYTHMEMHPEVGVCGGWVEIFGEGIRSHVGKSYLKHEEIVCGVLFGICAHSHPGVFFRREAFMRHSLYYDELYQHAEDFQLWLHASKYVKLANLSVVILKYRDHASKVSSVHSSMQWQNTLSAVLTLLNELGINPTSDEIDCHTLLCGPIPQCGISTELLLRSRNWLQELVEVAAASKKYDKQALCKLASRVWLTACYLAQCQGIYSYRIWNSVGSDMKKLVDPICLIKLIFRSLLSVRKK